MRRGTAAVIGGLGFLGLLIAAYLVGSSTDAPRTVPATPGSPTTIPSPASPRLLKAPDDFFITSLRARQYPGGPISTERVVADGPTFTKYAVTYPSDGLKISGLMNVPKRPGPLPAVILNHGYYPVPGYKPGDGTERELDYLADRGYLTVAPDYRNHAGSDRYPDPYLTRNSYVIDVLNLHASLQQDVRVQRDAIGIWGHSMGGGVTLQALAIRPDAFRAAVVYGSMQADEFKNYERITTVWNPGYKSEFDKRFNPTPEVFAKMSASSYFADFKTPVAIHHGTGDTQVPYQWSVDLHNALQAAGKSSELFSYPDAPHIFQGETWQEFMGRVTAFFDRTLR